ncbi:hypothetical protein WIS52_20415 [Pseudonocardia nematodicida]|uniref:Uncharacterized protein n=1 Tax=Pseudonocardia nematodicida TaxID=1206997 RepID=A0ABV1KG26_9PSEU
MSSSSPTPDQATPAPSRQRTESARPVMAGPTAGAPGDRSRCCDRCGQAPADPMQQILMSAVWLVAGPAGPIQACYCRACPPDAAITDLTCLRCGDGPLLAGELAADPHGQLPAPAQEWLLAAGWRLDGPLCPGCQPRQTR